MCYQVCYLGPSNQIWPCLLCSNPGAWGHDFNGLKERREEQEHRGGGGGAGEREGGEGEETEEKGREGKGASQGIFLEQKQKTTKLYNVVNVPSFTHFHMTENSNAKLYALLKAD